MPATPAAPTFIIIPLLSTDPKLAETVGLPRQCGPHRADNLLKIIRLTDDFDRPRSAQRVRRGRTCWLS
jgi:hypothetical protein